MTPSEVIEMLDKLPAEQQEQAFVHLAKSIAARRGSDTHTWISKKSFEEACDIVFRENRELLQRLADG